jgi:hypothetical protein
VGPAPIRLRPRPGQPHLRDLESRSCNGENHLPKILKRRSLPISIARELNDAGNLRGEAKQWTARQVGRVPDNPAYVGRCVFDGELVPGSWQAIVDDATWQQARAVREADKRRISLLPAAKGGPYLLSGMLHGGICGRRLVHRATHSGKREGIYVCIEPGGKWCPGGSIGSGRADDFVAQRFLDRCQSHGHARHSRSFLG